MKVIAFYLPQFHEIQENNKWWGKGFTEWTTLKKAKNLFVGHNQPRVPLNNNYYNLTNKETIVWQSKIAKEHGIYGFCFYHYWFNGKLLLEKPLEIFLNSKDIDINFCFSWANENWTRAWVSKEDSILIAQKYGSEKKWRLHFEYLLPYFKDSRYIRDDNKPLFIIYRPNLIPNLKEMIFFFNRLAVENGLNGIKFAYQSFQENFNDQYFDYQIEFQPNYARKLLNKHKLKFIKSLKYKLSRLLNFFNINIEYLRLPGLIKEDYNKIWHKILSMKGSSKKVIPGAFVDWDNTPRRGDKGSLMLNANPKSFKKYFKSQLINAKKNYSSDYLFFFAWNEWTEGGYLEPDTCYGYEYLEIIKELLQDHSNSDE